MVIGDFLARSLVDGVFSAPGQYSSLDVVIGIHAYAVQIYCDFSGYTDMAIGIALLLGLTLPVNFDRPYTATSLRDFWRRWHITLSRWLRDYLYIPLGGSRRSAVATYRNVVITMVLAGLWHGAGWTFLVWGALHGVALAIEHFFGDRQEAPRPRAARAGRPWSGRSPSGHAGVRGPGLDLLPGRQSRGGRADHRGHLHRLEQGAPVSAGS